MRSIMRLLNQSTRLPVMRSFASSQIIFNKPPTTTAAPQPAATSGSIPLNKVTGLSQAVLTTNEPVGPGAAKNAEYKVPEYFNYNKNSYFEAEVEMAKYRCPQPSAERK